MSNRRKTAGGIALNSDLAALRNAIELYAAEHDGNYPGATITLQLTQDSNNTDDTTSMTKTATEVYGPHLKEIPPQPVGNSKGATGVYITSVATDTPQ